MNFLEKVLPCQIWRDDYLNALACLLETSFCLCLFSSTGQVTLASSWAWAPMFEALAFLQVSSCLCALFLILLCKEVACS